jgi:Asp-tRNA(Asn)/Glu-tRNA(Gln) amidotransferase A subunit family amidase
VSFGLQKFEHDDVIAVALAAQNLRYLRALAIKRLGGLAARPVSGSNYNTADLLTTGGSSLAGMQPPADAFVVAKLRAEC